VLKIGSYSETAEATSNSLVAVFTEGRDYTSVINVIIKLKISFHHVGRNYYDMFYKTQRPVSKFDLFVRLTLLKRT
jgi:hypothetical protein